MRRILPLLALLLAASLPGCRGPRAEGVWRHLRPSPPGRTWEGESGWLRMRLAVAGPSLERAQGTEALARCFPAWMPFDGRVRAGDELWRYASPMCTWREGRGRAGLALVRAGRVIAATVDMEG